MFDRYEGSNPEVVLLVDEICRLLTPEELKLLEFNDGEVSRSFQERMIDRFGEYSLACEDIYENYKNVKRIVEENRFLIQDVKSCCEFFEKFKEDVFIFV